MSINNYVMRSNFNKVSTWIFNNVFFKQCQGVKKYVQ